MNQISACNVLSEVHKCCQRFLASCWFMEMQKQVNVGHSQVIASGWRAEADRFSIQATWKATTCRVITSTIAQTSTMEHNDHYRSLKVSHLLVQVKAIFRDLDLSQLFGWVPNRASMNGLPRFSGLHMVRPPQSQFVFVSGSSASQVEMPSSRLNPLKVSVSISLLLTPLKVDVHNCDTAHW